MVVKMMRWRHGPPPVKYEVKLIVRRLQFGEDSADSPSNMVVSSPPEMVPAKFMVGIKWKGQKYALSYLRRTEKKIFTREESAAENGAVIFEEEFKNVCSLSYSKDNVFNPWEIAFTVWNGANKGSKNKVPAFGMVSLNLAEYASAVEEKSFELNIPLTLQDSGNESPPSLCVALSLLEIRTSQELSESAHRSIVPLSSPVPSTENLSPEKDELSVLKAGLRKVKLFTNYVSSKRTKNGHREGEGSGSNVSDEGEGAYPFDSDSHDEFEERESNGSRNSFSYGTLAHANCVGGSFYSSTRINVEDEDCIYYSNRKSDVGCSRMDDSQPSFSQRSKFGILSWKRRKLNFRSPKARGEPLLRKTNGEEGGDDIDFDRRQLSSDESLWHNSDQDSNANRSPISEFGEDNFLIGSWEQKEVISRDGQLKLQTQVFFASIDQRSERAAGESACTALVTVIADWFQANPDLMPIKSQFDSLIREGSLEWRNLCQHEAYIQRFPDKHFDLETVLHAKRRHLSVRQDKSFVGFFHPDGTDEDQFDFLRGAMSFDSIWDEISRAAAELLNDDEPQVYIVSWNDHFFILKVEREAYYIIDTLGERLYEGCNQAYILKFDRNTTILKMPSEAQAQTSDEISEELKEAAEPMTKDEEKLEVVCQGKESCKEYIKNFLAAIPIRELLVDIKKGLMASIPLHHRLQIEFNFTQTSQPIPPSVSVPVSSISESVPLSVSESVPLSVSESVPLSLLESVPLSLLESVPVSVSESVPVSVSESVPVSVSSVSTPISVAPDSVMAVQQIDLVPSIESEA